MASVVFDGDNKLIVIQTGFTLLTSIRDLYSQWKEWSLLSDNLKYLPAFRTIGGDPLSAVINAGAYFFLQNDVGWRIRPFEGDHELTIEGNLYPENSTLPMFVPTLGTFTVSIKLERSSLTQQLQTAGGLTPIQNTMLLELYMLMGLDPSRPLKVTPTYRKVPADGTDISQTIVEIGNDVTVTRV